MESIRLFIKAKNFLVYQGAVENIAMKNPKERTALFEEISRSHELKDEYDKAKAEMSRADEDTQFNYHKRKNIAAEKREAKAEKEEAEKFQRLKAEVGEKQASLYLFKLYHADRRLKGVKEDMKAKDADAKVKETEKEAAEAEVHAKMAEAKKVARDVQKMERAAHKLEKELADARPHYIRSKEAVAHQERKIAEKRRVLTTYEKDANVHSQKLRELEERRDELQGKRDVYEEGLTQESQDLELDLSPAQIAEYYRLAEKSGIECAAVQSELDSMLQEKSMDVGHLENEKRRKGELASKLRRKQNEMQEAQDRLAHLADKVESDKAKLSAFEEELAKKETEVTEARCELEKHTERLDTINTQMRDLDVEGSENSRSARKQELLDNMKRVYSGQVLGRLLELCQPTHSRYKLAVTKVLGKNMNAIVVDTETTAKSCIQYLKEQRGEPETFLALNYIDVSPINEQLREIRQPRGVKLVFDVIKISEPKAKKAVQFACGNALVCESAEDARTLAYGSGGVRYKSVSLDGTLFQKSGVISGGSQELKSRAKKWDEKASAALRKEKSALMEKLRELHNQRKNEFKLDQIRTNISALTAQLKYTKTDREKKERENLERLELELEKLKAEEESLQPRMDEISARLEDREVALAKVQKKLNGVRDIVFADFCKQLNIKNIRVYEDRELRFHNEKKDKLKAFDNQIDRLNQEIDFLKESDKKASKKQLEEQLKSLEKELEDLRKEEEKNRKEMARLDKLLEAEAEKKAEKKAEAGDREAEVAEAKKDLALVHKAANQISKQQAALEARQAELKQQRHSLLQTCKLQNIHLPMSRGSLGDIDEDEESQEMMDTDAPPTSSQRSAGSSQAYLEMLRKEEKLRINYTGLESELKDLESDDDINKALKRMDQELSDAQAAMERMQAPNMKAVDRLETVRERETETVGEFESARKKAKKARNAFEKVKAKRFDMFNKTFETVSQEIDEIYKSLSRNQSAQAYLGPENSEEPYLEGISYNCVAPGKRYRPMDNLSGGEKTVAALALLFAIHASQPSPFFVLDEIDAALDNTNIGKVAAFIRDQAQTNMQVIVISLKEEFYSRAEALIGIYPKPDTACCVSGSLSLDLTQFRDPHSHE